MFSTRGLASTQFGCSSSCTPTFLRAASVTDYELGHALGGIVDRRSGVTAAHCPNPADRGAGYQVMASVTAVIDYSLDGLHEGMRFPRRITRGAEGQI